MSRQDMVRRRFAAITFFVLGVGAVTCAGSLVIHAMWTASFSRQM